MATGDLRSEEEVQEYLENLGIEYRFQCFGEKKSDGCHRLGDFLEAVKKDAAKACRVYKVNCEDHQYGHSCYKYGNYLATGKGGVTKDDKAAYESYKTGCDSKYWPACHNAAQILASGKATDKREYEKAAELYKVACDNDLSESCYYLGSYYIVGKEGLPQNFKEGFKYSKQACDLGHIPACINISMMYKNGHGVEKDQEKSKLYSQKAKDLREQIANPEPAITFGETS
ncbi:unnamed protein product [Owenia fusiformis]|uniref:Uncharacterized protein n=1 Tax=Owenia fusiformis TaxID=6347 RepID=A0A8J1XZ68_OWEFU|nr:unnamed protein product [Owenia fusiformis]